MNINFNKELVMKGLGKAGQYSKLIVVEGIKSVALQGVTKIVNTTFTQGPAAVKNLDFEKDIIGLKTGESKPKKKLFGKRNKEAEALLEAVETETVDAVTETIEDVKVEIIDKK